MVFNSHATNQDIVSEVLKISGATTASYSLNDITRRVNAGMVRVFRIGYEITGDASLDDESKSTPPIGYQNLSSGVNAYGVTGFTGTFTNFVKLEALDSSGNSTELIEENIVELNFLNNYKTTITGTPAFFVKVGGTYYIRPTPNYAVTNGLAGFGNRKPDFFSASDTTKEAPRWLPEFYLSRFAAQPFLEENKLRNSQSNYQHILEDEAEIRSYFVRLNKNSRQRMSAAYQNNK